PLGFSNYSISSIFGSKYTGTQFNEPTRNDSDDDDGKKSDVEVPFGTGARLLLHKQEEEEEITRHTVRAKLFRMDREHQWKERTVEMLKLNYPKDCEKSLQI
ncbi:12494_t:CDS:2, partial [Racocetra persica]